MEEILFNQIVAKWNPKLQAMSITLGVSDVSEVKQRLLIALWRAWKKFDPNRPAKFETYATTVLRNEQNSILQSIKRRPQLVELKEEALIGELEKDMDDLMLDLRERLSPHSCKVLDYLIRKETRVPPGNLRLECKKIKAAISEIF